MSMSRSTANCPALVAVFLKSFQVRFRSAEVQVGVREGVDVLIAEVLVAAGRDCDASLRLRKGEGQGEVGKVDNAVKDGVALLVNMFEQFREGLFDDVEFSRVSLYDLL